MTTAAMLAGPQWGVAFPSPRRVLRALTSAVLVAATLAAIAGAALVVLWRLSFAPVLSPSMVPTFGPGDLVVSRALPTSRIAVGDVLVLPVPGAAGERYVHRVTQVRHVNGGVLVRTKGDNNPAPDPWQLRVTSHAVPKVVTSVPAVGRVGLKLRSRGPKLAGLLVVAVLALVGIKRALLDGE